jgi:CRP-like cAMP-binding protein
LAPHENHLIELLPGRDKLRLLEVCTLVDMDLAEVMAQRGEPTRHVYFPVGGFISLVARVEGTPGVEVGMVGREGMLGVHLVLGVTTSPLHAVVQGEGPALRLDARAFRAQLAASSVMRRQLHRYLYVLMAQQAASAACMRFHLTSQRLARWLLMSQDRAHAKSFHVTQEFLAYMLGMRRVGITSAASTLQRNGLIEYHRGEMTVLDRAGLEAVACSCYAADQKNYADLLS